MADEKTEVEAGEPDEASAADPAPADDVADPAEEGEDAEADPAADESRAGHPDHGAPAAEKTEEAEEAEPGASVEQAEPKAAAPAKGGATKATKAAKTGKAAGDEAPAARKAPAPSQSPKRKVESRRVTPAGTASRPPAPKAKGGHKAHGAGDGPTASSRYTPPDRSQMPSPVWVPIVMFALLGIGALVIVLNYVGALGGVSNIKLVIGLALILGGIITATQYR